MDIKSLIAQASAPHMQRFADALAELRAAHQAATDAGFGVSLRFPAASIHDAELVVAQQHALSAVIYPGVFPVLEYRATIQERSDA